MAVKHTKKLFVRALNKKFGKDFDLAEKVAQMMRNRKRFLKWNKFRFSRTFGTAHQESRSLDE